jgi:hypothetical protein
MIGAYNDSSDSGGRSRRDEEDDFDALVASGETMKVSLTPSRLKNFDVSWHIRKVALECIADNSGWEESDIWRI